jgi:HAD superfamily hydrolase (TIGR01509 family)
VEVPGREELATDQCSAQAERSDALQGKRKPESQVFSTVTDHLNIPAEQAVFIDDREANVIAAREHGMVGVHMTGVQAVTEALRDIGIRIPS